MLSPKLFAVYVNDLLSKLNCNGLIAYALADDIVVAAIGQMDIQRAMLILKNECIRLDLSINKKKSGLMIIRNDIRQSTLSKAKRYGGYPIVNKYTYLGVTIDCTGRFDILG